MTEQTHAKKIYLDYAASTPVDESVAEKMMQCLTIDGNFANPASRSHTFGWIAEEAVEIARQQIAELIGANNREIVWTSGATESNNLAIKGICEAYGDGHIVSNNIEHKAVLDPIKTLVAKGFTSTIITAHQGIVTPEQVKQALQSDTRIVSVMAVNNEIGTKNDLAGIATVIKEFNAQNNTCVVFHVDAAQGAGKVALDVEQIGIDMLSLSGHKIYGPKGIGALYVRKTLDTKPFAQIHGGGHEFGMRSGTLATHQIVGMGAAFEVAQQRFDADHEHVAELQQTFLSALQSQLDCVILHGNATQRVANIVNVSFEGISNEDIMFNMPNIAVSSGSACNSKSLTPSFVLTGIGVPAKIAASALRFSFGRYTTLTDVQSLTQQLIDVVTKLQKQTVPELQIFYPDLSAYK